MCPVPNGPAASTVYFNVSGFQVITCSVTKNVTTVKNMHYSTSDNGNFKGELCKKFVKFFESKKCFFLCKNHFSKLNCNPAVNKFNFYIIIWAVYGKTYCSLLISRIPLCIFTQTFTRCSLNVNLLSNIFPRCSWQHVWDTFASLKTNEVCDGFKCCKKATKTY